ncbi:MOSC domain-containing protein [Gracilibacillus sp. YIM 98692]|uniref:MOSC domain-containing protein n=1 Tax=Gracilibacillus sp. YIM 98692 TaxID=2663532 RepID=UPI0013D2CA6D|nr:MOSC domain-containing protein [Gracilibacillus sp. YIM 98692]
MYEEIVSLNVGKPDTYIFGDREIKTGFVKKPTNEACFLTKTGFVEDGQADLKNHGGEEKALLMYPYGHYPYWEKLYKQTFSIPAFGENITIKELTEKDIYIGDTFQLGEAVVQVSQPRQPCYKIAEYHQIKDMPSVVTQTGYSGFYFRVLEEGKVNSEDSLKKLTTEDHQVTPFDVFDCLFHDRKNKERMMYYKSLAGLASNVKATLSKRIEKLG